MSPAWLVRRAIPFYPLGWRLLVLALSAGWVGASVGGLLFLVYEHTRPAGAPAALYGLLGAVLLLAGAGHAALGRGHRRAGVLFLLGACAVGTFMVYWAYWAYWFSMLLRPFCGN